MVKLVKQNRKARMGRNPATGEAIKISGEGRREGADRQAAQGCGAAQEIAGRSVTENAEGSNAEG